MRKVDGRVRPHGNPSIFGHSLHAQGSTLIYDRHFGFHTSDQAPSSCGRSACSGNTFWNIRSYESAPDYGEDESLSLAGDKQF